MLSAGPLDAAFGAGGVSAVDVPSAQRELARAVVIDGSGRTVVAAHTSDPGGKAGRAGVLLVRYRPDGSLDPTFGGGGRVLVPDAGEAGPQALAIDAAGRIVVAFGNFSFARVNADGSIDRTFGDGGVVRSTTPGHSEARALIVRSDGRILAGGAIDAPGAHDFGFVQVNADGSPDVTFGEDGTLRIGGAREEAVEAMRLLPNGAVLAAGESRGDFVLFRLTPRGQIDRGGFGAKGFVTTDFGRPAETARGIAVLADGRIVLAGVSGGDAALARYSAGGAIDPTFGTGGKVRYDFGSAADDVTDVFTAPGGKLLLTGSTGVGAGGNAGRIASARLDANGAADGSYGTGGRALVDVTAASDLATAAAVHRDGRVVIVGNNVADSLEDILVVRLTAAGAPDAGFGAGGRVRTNFDGPSSFVPRHAVTLPGGKVLVAGEQAGFFPSAVPVVLRFNANGTPDATFGRGGRNVLPPDLFEHLEERLHVLSDGRFVLAASSAFSFSGGPQFAERRTALYRFKADGSADGTFGDGGRLLIPGVGGQLSFDHHDRILVANKTSVTRYTPDGAPDASFGTNGVAAVTNEEHVDISAIDVAVTAGDGVVVLYVDAQGRTTLARLTPGGTHDAAFGTGGFARYGPAPSVEALEAILVQADGKILAAGAKFTGGPAFTGAGASDFLVTRFNANGTVDGTFGTGGQTTFTLGATDSFEQIALAADGKILLAGATSFAATPSHTSVARLLANGQPDLTFGRRGLATAAFGGVAPGAVLPAAGGTVVVASGVAVGRAALARFAANPPGGAGGVTAKVQGGTLIVTGTAGDDVIRLTRSAGGAVTIENGDVSIPVGATFSKIVIRGLGGDDAIDASALALATSAYGPRTLPVTVDGGAGDDTVVGGPAGDVLNGGVGDDELFGQAGNDTVFAHRGDDAVHGGDGRDYLNGGPGADGVFGGAGDDQVFALDGSVDTVDGGGGFDRLKGDEDDARSDVEGVLA